MHLGEAIRKGISARRLWVLVNGLPLEEAATWADVRAQRPQWSTENELAARLIEATHHWGALTFHRLHGLSTGKWPKESDFPPVQQTIEHPDRPSAKGSKREKKPVERDPEVIKRFFQK